MFLYLDINVTLDANISKNIKWPGLSNLSFEMDAVLVKCEDSGYSLRKKFPQYFVMIKKIIDYTASSNIENYRSSIYCTHLVANTFVVS